jgi:hypothetical protein
MVIPHLSGDGVAIIRARERSSYFSIVESVDNVDNDSTGGPNQMNGQNAYVLPSESLEIHSLSSSDGDKSTDDDKHRMKQRAQLFLHGRSLAVRPGVHAKPHQCGCNDRDRSETERTDQTDQLTKERDGFRQQPSDESDEKGTAEPDGPVSFGIRCQVAGITKDSNKETFGGDMGQGGG